MAEIQQLREYRGEEPATTPGRPQARRPQLRHPELVSGRRSCTATTWSSSPTTRTSSPTSASPTAGLQQYDKAIDLFHQAKKLDPDHWQAYYNEVVVLAFDLKKIDAGQQVLGQLQQMQPANPDVAKLAEAPGQAAHLTLSFMTRIIGIILLLVILRMAVKNFSAQLKAAVFGPPSPRRRRPPAPSPPRPWSLRRLRHVHRGQPRVQGAGMRCSARRSAGGRDRGRSFSAPGDGRDPWGAAPAAGPHLVSSAPGDTSPAGRDGSLPPLHELAPMRRPWRPARLADVALPLPLPDPLTYEVPAAWAPRPSPGVRARVLIGKRRLTGLIVSGPRAPARGDEPAARSSRSSTASRCSRRTCSSSPASPPTTTWRRSARSCAPCCRPTCRPGATASVWLTDAGALALPRGAEEAAVIEALREGGRMTVAELQGARGRRAAGLSTPCSPAWPKVGGSAARSPAALGALRQRRRAGAGGIADHLAAAGRSAPGARSIDIPRRPRPAGHHGRGHRGGRLHAGRAAAARQRSACCASSPRSSASPSTAT